MISVPVTRVNSSHQSNENESLREIARIENNLCGVILKEGERLDLLIEICSGIEVPCNSEPYVTINFNGDKVHETSRSKIGVKNPIWTLSTGSLFIFSVGAMDLFSAVHGLVFVLSEDHSLASVVGAVEVTAKQLYEWNGERVEYDLAQNNEVKGKLALRVRRASVYDKEFMQSFSESVESEKSSHGAKKKKEDTFFNGKTMIDSIKTKYKKNEKNGTGGKTTKYLVRPGPDPKRPEETTWLKKEEIEKEMMKESTEWVDMGTGSLGDIYLEVLRCEGLPNLDCLGMMGNKTDAFVSIVYEDSTAQTNVIDDCLSPCWLPWSNRAFVLHMTHPSSTLSVGVIDYDQNTGDNHDLVGRVSIDLTNFKSGMEYILRYQLDSSAKLPPRSQTRGTIMLRIRLDLLSERDLLISQLLTFRKPPVFQVNSKTKKELAVINQTCVGKIDPEEYSLAVINGYITEVTASLEISYYIEDAFTCIFLWRGHFCANIPSINWSQKRFAWAKVYLPMHSAIAFLCGVKLVENPALLPSFFFLSMVWILLGSVGVRCVHANPWLRVKSFKYLLQCLLYGNPPVPCEPIKPGENSEAVEAESKMREARVNEALELANASAIDLLKEQEQYEKEQELIGDAGEISTETKRDAFVVDPRKAIIKSYLYPVQVWLAALCDVVRVIRNIVLWEEPYFSFWVTLACGMVSFCFLFVPLDVVLYWSAKACVWMFLGPWMKLVDIYVVSKDQTVSEEEKATREQKEEGERRKATEDAVLKARISREEAQKLKGFKQYFFGDYISAVQMMKVDRYIDVPLPKSSAVPYNPKDHRANNVTKYNLTRVPGHHVVGDLVPRVLGKGLEMQCRVPTDAETKGHMNGNCMSKDEKQSMLTKKLL